MTRRLHNQHCAACDEAEFAGVTYESTHRPPHAPACPAYGNNENIRCTCGAARRFVADGTAAGARSLTTYTADVYGINQGPTRFVNGVCLLRDVDQQLRAHAEELARLTARLAEAAQQVEYWNREYFRLYEAKISSDAEQTTMQGRDMVCEQHPFLRWPHGDCVGPGCPLSAQEHLFWLQLRDSQQSALIDETRIQDGLTRIRQLEAEVARLRAQLDKMTPALQKLTNEVSGWLNDADHSLRDLMGNTNVAVMRDRLEIARATLSGEEPGR